MPDTSGRKRPNANHPLTEKKAREDELVFYYSREQRLAKAPPSVQALYDETPRKRFGLFRVLTATRPLAMLFASIMILCAFILVISLIGRSGGLSGSRYILSGNRLAVTAVQFQDETIVVMVKTAQDEKTAYTGPVDIAVSPASAESDPADYPVFIHQVFFSLNSREEYRFSLPFTAEKLVMVLQGGGEKDTAQFTVKVE
jgi:hypothetical protein